MESAAINTARILGCPRHTACPKMVLCSTRCIEKPIGFVLCDDCPPVGYPTDKTRCKSCPHLMENNPVSFVNPTQVDIDQLRREGDERLAPQSIRLLPYWVDALPLQMQAVLVMAMRGPDGFPKEHDSKPIVRYMRAAVMSAAHIGRALNPGEHVASVMTLRGFDDDAIWQDALEKWQGIEDALPLHYYQHIKNAAQVIAYQHPDPMFRARWFSFYVACCDYLHNPIESQPAMLKRLSDFGRRPNQIIDDFCGGG